MTDSTHRAKVGHVREAPVPRRSVGEGVADHIRQLVFFGELRDGQRVPQREIAQAQGVSSVPVHEALASLQREGVVTIEPNRGAFINGLDADVVTEQFYIFGRIYGLATRTTTERAEPSVLASLSELARRIGAERDLDALLALSIQFQMGIVDHGGSKRLRALIAPFSRIVPGNFYATIPGSAEVTRRGVAAMARAIASGSPSPPRRPAGASSTRSGSSSRAGFVEHRIRKKGAPCRPNSSPPRGRSGRRDSSATRPATGSGRSP